MLARYVTPVLDGIDSGRHDGALLAVAALVIGASFFSDLRRWWVTR